MDLVFLIERLEKYVLEECPKVPLFSGSRAVNEEEARARLGQLREAVPHELTEAARILQERETLLAEADREGQQRIAAAQEEARRLVAEHRIMQEAKQQAAAARQRAEREAETLLADADEYVFDTLSHLQQELSRLLRVVDNGLQKMEADRERRLQLKSG